MRPIPAVVKHARNVLPVDLLPRGGGHEPFQVGILKKKRSHKGREVGRLREVNGKAASSGRRWSDLRTAVQQR